MRFSRWIDHLPPWLAFGAVTSTGIYEPWELATMASPLVLAAFIEWRQWGQGSWRRPMEMAALAAVLGLAWARIGLMPTVIVTLFLLCGIRLSLPREPAYRRQLLLMGFLIWITTAISTFEIHFLAWSVLWVAGAGTVLMQHAWEGSASLRNGPVQRAPYGRVPLWVASSLLLSAGFFVLLPRVTLGLRTFPWGVAGLTSFQAGMSDSIDLGQGGPIAPNSDVVLRVLPPNGLPGDEWAQYSQSLALLRGVVLESVEGQRWSPILETLPPAVGYVDPGQFDRAHPPKGVLAVEYFVAPSPQGILPLPYGRLGIAPPPGMPVRSGPGGSLRWMFPSRRPIPLQLHIERTLSLPERPPGKRRIEQLTQTGQGTESAERWSRRIVPEDVPALELSRRLTDTLRTFDYTLDNPSGSADNPLQDFLERSQAGHCEYFASALALMLRHRGVPARVVNGYRLGPWISEGGYWLVTQNEAHSWVEFFDSGSGRWQVADPTPFAPPGGIGSRTFWASLQRWTDALKYRWDRHIVRFSDQDQLVGLEWLRAKAASLPDWRPERTAWLGALSALAASLAIWSWVRFRPAWRRWPRTELANGHGLKPLQPLLRAAAGEVPPTAGETLRQWLQRLSSLAPERAGRLEAMADEADGVAYGGQDPALLKALAKDEAKAWRRSRKR